MSFLDTSSTATPPDTIIAAGPNSVVEAVNTDLQITDKSGNVLMPALDFSQFLSPVFQPGDFFSDPSVVYDDVAQRFYVGGLEIRFTPLLVPYSLFDFAVSKTADPRSASDWTVFRSVVSVSDRATQFADFPQVGYNGDAVFVSVNRFNNLTGEFTDNLVLAIDKDSILHPGPGANPTLTTFQTEVKTGSDHKILMPARMHGAPGGLEYFTQSGDDDKAPTVKTFNVVSETGYLSGSPTFTTTPVAVTPYMQSPGVPELTFVIDDSALGAEWVNNRLVTGQNVGLKDGLNHARWYEFDTSGAAPTLVQQGDQSPGPGVSTSFPSVAVNAAGDVAMTYVQSASDGGFHITQTPSMVVTAWTPGDDKGVMEPAVLVQAGVLGGAGGFRGGDYSATVVDPVDGSFWSGQEYQADNLGADDWGTWVANYTVTFGPLVFALDPPAVREGSPDFTLTVNGEHFTNSAVVNWNGTPLATTFVSDTKLTARVPASLLVEDGGGHPVTVEDPSRPAGHTTSNPVNFTVTESPLRPGRGTSFPAIHAGATLSGVLATFSDAYLGEPPGDYAATIHWGDGSALTPGTVTAVGPGQYKVTGSHTYTVPGRHPIAVTITDEGHGAVIVRDTVGVVGSVLTGTGDTIHATKGKLFRGEVATFSDSDAFHPASAYTAVISWGDGSASTRGGVVALGNGQFSVLGVHTYAQAGTDTLVISIRRGTAAAVTPTGTAAVAAAPPGSSDLAVAAVARRPFDGVAAALTGLTEPSGARFTAVVAAFTGAEEGRPAASYRATIDWGDGTTGPADAITADGLVFRVRGSHAYARPGVYRYRVVIREGGSSTTATGIIRVFRR
jgi:hypothetical protein